MTEPAAWFVVLTGLSFIPLLVVAVTPFLRFVIVFSAIRYALGLQQTPPNIVIITLALFLAFFVMGDTPGVFYNEVVGPFVNGTLTMDAAYVRADELLSGWLLPRTDGEALARLHQIAGEELPPTAEEVGLRFLVPAFMLSELTFAFKAAFFVMVPFLLIDLAVASVLMSLGIIMLPPITVSLPIKIMLFVLLDGWSLVGFSVAENALG